ncbi:helix-turn-helix transcriptional regulator [Limimaricola sp. AA108-03]|uniref:helix-turn-helix transcriptional regulator n=1 Tax=Limimaricola sp. AA108-03 TaxID=3425945 RepID=UPI003D76A804
MQHSSFAAPEVAPPFPPTTSPYLQAPNQRERWTFVLDPEARIISECRQDLSALSSLFVIGSDGHLVAIEARVDAELRGILRALDGQKASRSLLVVRAPATGDLFRLEITALAQRGSENRLLATLHIEALEGQGLLHSELKAAYGLSQAELRVADRLHEGLAPKEIAAAHNVSENTVKFTLKSLFSKTGVRRQAELALLLAWFAS